MCLGLWDFPSLKSWGFWVVFSEEGPGMCLSSSNSLFQYRYLPMSQYPFCSSSFIGFLWIALMCLLSSKLIQIIGKLCYIPSPSQSKNIKSVHFCPGTEILQLQSVMVFSLIKVNRVFFLLFYLFLQDCWVWCSLESLTKGFWKSKYITLTHFIHYLLLFSKDPKRIEDTDSPTGLPLRQPVLLLRLQTFGHGACLPCYFLRSTLFSRPGSWLKHRGILSTLKALSSHVLVLLIPPVLMACPVPGYQNNALCIVLR